MGIVKISDQMHENLRLASTALSRSINAATGKRFLTEVLEQGGARDAIDNFKAFRGREPTIDALLRHQGMN